MPPTKRETDNLFTFSYIRFELMNNSNKTFGPNLGGVLLTNDRQIT